MGITLDDLVKSPHWEEIKDLPLNIAISNTSCRPALRVAREENGAVLIPLGSSFHRNCLGKMVFSLAEKVSS